MFANGYYAKIWEIKKIADKYSDIRISISVKDKNTDRYDQTFGGYVRLVGQAHEQMKYLSEGDKFKIVRCGVKNHYDKDKKTTYWDPVVFEMDAIDPADPKPEDNPFL